MLADFFVLRGTSLRFFPLDLCRLPGRFHADLLQLDARFRPRLGRRRHLLSFKRLPFFVRCSCPCLGRLHGALVFFRVIWLLIRRRARSPLRCRSAARGMLGFLQFWHDENFQLC